MRKALPSSIRIIFACHVATEWKFRNKRWIHSVHSHIDTLVYALDKIHELFVIKLSYRYVMICGDGKTVELLYKIKSDYSVKIEWLHMFGSWHLIKD